jgi:hypothetical protein
MNAHAHNHRPFKQKKKGWEAQDPSLVPVSVQTRSAEPWC